MGTTYLSLSACGGITTRQALAYITAAGIQHVELAIGVKPDADAAAAIEEYRSSGTIFRAHHAFVWEAVHRPFNLAKEIDRDYFQRAIEWLAKMSVTAYSVHPGSYTDRPLAAWDLFLTNLEWLRKQCSSYNIELGIETMYPIYDENRRYFLDDLESIDRLQTMFPDLKWVLDLAHLNLWPEHRLEAIDLLSDRLLEIHISDNDGHRDLHTTITEKTWWLPYLDRLPISVPYVLETRLARIRSCHQIAIGYQRVVNLLESADRHRQRLKPPLMLQNPPVLKRCSTCLAG
jgi:sugar phosphate isomerase/epimerase